MKSVSNAYRSGKKGWNNDCPVAGRKCSLYKGIWKLGHSIDIKEKSYKFQL